jgi:glycosyltransferase involved in cell wall biosynthesis
MATTGVSEPPGHRASFLVPPPDGEVAELPAAPTFSIVIPAYQAAETIAAALDSALGQVHPAHEVIVVDDGSTDDLEDVLEPYLDRIAVVHKANGGAASARNRGAEAASGEFIAVLDADDRFHPRRLEALAELAVARPDLDLITTDTRMVVDGEVAGRFHEKNPFAVEAQRLAILESCFVGGWPAVRRSRLRAIGGFDESLPIAHDWDCWARLILDGARAGLVDRPYYDYTLREGSLTSSRVASLRDRVRLLEKAAENPALLPEDRPTLARAYRRHRSRAVVAEASAIVSAGGRERWRLPGLALGRGVETRVRALALLAFISPALAKKRLP